MVNLYFNDEKEIENILKYYKLLYFILVFGTPNGTPLNLLLRISYLWLLYLFLFCITTSKNYYVILFTDVRNNITSKTIVLE